MPPQWTNFLEEIKTSYFSRGKIHKGTYVWRSDRVLSEFGWWFLVRKELARIQIATTIYYLSLEFWNLDDVNISLWILFFFCMSQMCDEHRTLNIVNSINNRKPFSQKFKLCICVACGEFCKSDIQNSFRMKSLWFKLRVRPVFARNT